MTNVLLKMNTKLGGVNTVFSRRPNMPEFLKERFSMVVGIDATHPSPGILLMF